MRNTEADIANMHVALDLTVRANTETTMNIKLIVNTDHAREVFKNDLYGEVIYRDKSDTINFLISNEIESDIGNLCFQFILKIPKATSTNIKELEQVCISWCNSIFPDYFQSKVFWNFFNITWIDIFDYESLKKNDKYARMEFDIKLKDDMNSVLHDSIETITIVKEKFEKAKNRLLDISFHSTPLGFKESTGEAIALFQTLENIVKCSADIGRYGASDIRYAMQNYQELAKRKMENNHNYQVSLNNLQKIAYGISFPKCWSEKPNA